MKKIQVLFPEPQMQRLKRLAKIEDRPISEIIRRATEEYLAKMPSNPLRDAAAAIPVFDGGETFVSHEHFRELAHSDRTGTAS
jgi:predicted DNA-binding protein